ncbi:hypothetical protein [Liberiplasma polymorphum]|uniref:hypothetical protein n=1 Tax=Liberiplasma polymorphum TaxID=3374570 RepID=UPI003772EAE7
MSAYLISNKKRIPILMLLILMLIGSRVAFAFWDNTTQVINDNEIVLGEGAILTVNKQVTSPKILVPKGNFKGINEVDEIIISYHVYFNKEGILKVTVDKDSISIGDGEHPFNDIVILQISSISTFENEEAHLEEITPFSLQRNEDGRYEVTIYFRVFLTKLANQEDYQIAYDLLKGQTISFDIVFEALPIN